MIRSRHSSGVRIRISDRAVNNYMRRFCDDEIERQSQKGQSLVKRAIDYCKSKIHEYPNLSKVIAILLKVTSYFNSIAGGFAVGSGIALTGVVLIKKLKGIANGPFDLPIGLGALLVGIIACLEGVVRWKASKAITNTLNEGEERR